MISRQVGTLLCQRQSYLKTSEQVVVSCIREDERFAVILDDTILFPTGGGQPCDRGHLNDVPITECTRKGLEAVHYCENPFQIGEKVTVKLDWSRRFDAMQQHSGQHIISDLAMDLYHWSTFGWSLGLKQSYVEFEKVTPTKDQVKNLEVACNDIIRDSIPMSMVESDIKDGRPGSLPSDIQSGCLRTISFGNSSKNPCCGTHVSSTAHLQAIKFLHMEVVRGGNTRLWYLCGDRVLSSLESCVERERAINEVLSTRPEEFVDRIKKKLLIIKDLTKKIKKLEKERR